MKRVRFQKINNSNKDIVFRNNNNLNKLVVQGAKMFKNSKIRFLLKEIKNFNS